MMTSHSHSSITHPGWSEGPDGILAYAPPQGEPVKAAFSVALPEPAEDQLPDEIQYMPPGRHRIRASRAGKPVELDVEVTQTTATALSDWLTRQLALAAAGAEDKPFFDFNHDDREAAAWPIKIFWAGDDPKTGGVRAKLEWSGVGRKAIEDRAFRRFSPTFLLDAAGRVIGSETNMGGLVNRAAFKRIQPLFAKGQDPQLETQDSKHVTMKELLKNLVTLGLVEASATEEADIIAQVKTKVTALQSDSTDLAAAKERLTALEAERDNAIRAKAEARVDAAIQAGRVAPKDENAKTFWVEALIRDEGKAVQALEALPPNPAFATVVTARDAGTGPVQNQEALQMKKLNDLRAANPGASFDTIFAKAQAEAPELFN